MARAQPVRLHANPRPHDSVMNRSRSFRFASPLLAAACLVPAILVAQQAPPPVTAAQLAKYDVNKNGQLDAEELTALQSDEARAAATPATSGAPAASDT